MSDLITFSVSVLCSPCWSTSFPSITLNKFNAVVAETAPFLSVFFVV